MEFLVIVSNPEAPLHKAVLTTSFTLRPLGDCEPALLSRKEATELAADVGCDFEDVAVVPACEFLGVEFLVDTTEPQS